MGKITLSGGNIVLVANTHNPSIVSKEWATEKGMIDEPVINFVHTPALSVIETDNLNIILDPDRLQVLAKKVDAIDKLPKIVEIYVSSLPEIPYTAMGFNLTYQVMNGDIEKLLIPSERFKKAFSEYKLGGIVVFNFDEFIVTLNLKSNDDKIVANFNFHSNVKKSEEILERLKRYEEVKESAKNVLEVLFE
jgi:hypothetical protein